MRDQQIMNLISKITFEFPFICQSQISYYNWKIFFLIRKSIFYVHVNPGTYIYPRTPTGHCMRDSETHRKLTLLFLLSCVIVQNQALGDEALPLHFTHFLLFLLLPPYCQVKPKSHSPSSCACSLRIQIRFCVLFCLLHD